MEFTPETKEKREVVYTALFVADIQALLTLFPPKHDKVFAHHSTIAFKPTSLDGIEVGRKVSLKVIGRARDDKADALIVENDKSKNIHPHITLSCAEGIPAFYSNELLAKAYDDNTVEMFAEPVYIDVVEGYFDGEGDVVEV